MGKISAILAVGNNWELGKSDSETGLPWTPIREDFKHFQATTKAIENIVMGPKTLEIITKLSGGKLLPGRQIYLLSKTVEVSPDQGVILVRNPQEVISLTIEQGKNLAIGGGKGVYESFLPYCDELIMTIVHDTFETDCFLSPSFVDGFTVDKEREKLLRPLSNEVCKVTVHYFKKN